MAAKRPLPPAPTVPMPSWARGTRPGLVEWFHYPSAFARQTLLYPRSMGRAKHPAGWKMSHHSDDGYVLHVMLRGELRHEVRERAYTARAGEACLIDVGEDVRYRTEGPGPAEFYYVWFNGRDLPRYVAELRADQNPLFGGIDVRRIRALVSELIALAPDHSPAGEVKTDGVLRFILAELFASRPPVVSFAEVANPDRPLSEAVRKAIDCITRFYETQLTIKDIAGMVGLSQNHFSRVFHQEVGIPPIAYLNRFRVEQAKRLLEGSDKTIAQIARRVGFADQNYLTRTFRQVVGTSPRRYRLQASQAQHA